MKYYIICLIFFLVGLFAFIISLSSIGHSFRYVQTTAVIVDFKRNTAENYYIPVYKFEVDGKEVTADGFITESIDDYKLGDEEEIMYNPKNYKQFDIGSKESSMWIFGISLLFMLGTLPYMIGYRREFVKYIKSFKKN